jgi:hypothetical protein
MIRITFDPAMLDAVEAAWWTRWSDRAEKATRGAVKAFEDWLAKPTPLPRPPFAFEFNNEIWKDLKDWLLQHVFHQKCAYCEREISGYYGDAEHYRPKSAVRHKTAAGKLEPSTCAIPDPASGRDVVQSHPGYFWLAYDWRNLVPACAFCNSGHGKNDRFEVTGAHIVLARLSQAEVDAMPLLAKPRQSDRWPGYYYLAPAALDAREIPLLLNPLNADDERNPRKHIRFGVRGIVSAVDESPFGKTSIEVFDLRKDRLRIARQEAQETFRSRFYDAMRELDPENLGQSKAQIVIRRYRAGWYPFSAAALDYHELMKQAEARLVS